MHGRRWFFRPVGLDGNDGGNEQERSGTSEEETSRPQEKINWHKIIWEDILPNALTIDVPYDVFWHLNPKKLKPFQIAYENKRRLRDEEQWMYWGSYGISALSVVIENVLSKNTKVEYVKKPILQQVASTSENLTEEEKKKQTEHLFMQLMIMETNHKSSKNKQ